LGSGAKVQQITDYFFQKTGVSITNTVNSSNRPTIILNDNIHFAMTGISEKEKTGPMPPSPGPTLLRQVI